MTNLKRSSRRLGEKIQAKVRKALLGREDGELRTADGRYYVREIWADGRMMPSVALPLARGAQVPIRLNIAVLLGHDATGQRVIVAADDKALPVQGLKPSITNMSDPDNVRIRKEQILSLRCRPSPTKALFAEVLPDTFVLNGTSYIWAGGDIDLSGQVPTTGNHRYTIVFWRSSTNGLSIASSTSQGTGTALDNTDLQEAITAGATDAMPIKAFVLVGDMTALNGDTDHSVDVRTLFNPRGVQALDDLTDVALSGVAQGDVLARKSSAWNNVNIAAESVVARITGGDVAGIAMGASTILARLASGSVVAATVAQIKTLLAIVKADISDFGVYRTQLTAARTYYVRTDGNDTNDGLTDSAGGAFLTGQKAVDVASALDNGGNTITVQFGAGTYTGAITLKSFVGSAQIVLRGDPTTPANVVISTTSSFCFNISGVVGQYSLNGFQLATTTSGNAINAGVGSYVAVQNIDFAAVANYDMSSSIGALIDIKGNLTISGACAGHLYASQGGRIRFNNTNTTTITGTPAITNFALCQNGLIYLAVVPTYSGSATGTRYNVSQNGVINTQGQAATYFPGNGAGSATTGGLYV